MLGQILTAVRASNALQSVEDLCRHFVYFEADFVVEFDVLGVLSVLHRPFIVVGIVPKNLYGNSRILMRKNKYVDIGVGIYWMPWRTLCLSPTHRQVLVTNRVRDSIWYFLVVFQLLDRYRTVFDSRRTVVQLLVSGGLDCHFWIIKVRSHSQLVA